MKTSNKVILLTSVFLLGMLVFYNLALKASYDRGEYKNTFADYTELNYKNFDKIVVKSSREFSVEIRRADTFAVKVNNSVKDQLKVSQSGEQLQLEFISDNDFTWYKQGAVIFLPLLKEVTTASSSATGQAGRPVGDWPNSVKIKGFDLDNLRVTQIENSQVVLKDNKISRLDATLSDRPLTSQLIVDSSNKIGSSDITVKGRNTLSLSNIYIPGKYDFSDSAIVNLTGAALKLLRK